MRILAIESSCDETAAAVVKDGREVLSNIISTQIQEHRLYGGVVPEIASRRHCENIVYVVDSALKEADMTLDDIDAVAVTNTPGLIGALLVGVNFAKSLAMSINKPLIPVHHIRGHIAANYLTFEELKPPFLCLVISGGHTNIVEVKDYTDFNIIGRTRDDAVGEAYDKAARAMGYPYPGGVEIDKAAKEGNENAFTLPHPSVNGSEYDFSFSGLKTAVLNTLNRASQKGEEIDCKDLSASFQKTVCEILEKKLMLAAKNLNYNTIALAGGVSANSGVRETLIKACEKNGYKLYLPKLSYCGDNAAMIGSQAYFEYQKGNIATFDLNAYASSPIDLPAR